MSLTALQRCHKVTFRCGGTAIVSNKEQEGVDGWCRIRFAGYHNHFGYGNDGGCETFVETQLDGRGLYKRALSPLDIVSFSERPFDWKYMHLGMQFYLNNHPVSFLAFDGDLIKIKDSFDINLSYLNDVFSVPRHILTRAQEWDNLPQFVIDKLDKQPDPVAV